MMKVLQRVAGAQAEQFHLKYSHCWWGHNHGERLAPFDESNFARAAAA